MHQDATLSHITNKTPGELGLESWTKLFAFGVGPLLGLLTPLFPSIRDILMGKKKLRRVGKIRTLAAFRA